jgi:1-acyl-sn-glycerol-3-phosphate acyltransferase
MTMSKTMENTYKIPRQIRINRKFLRPLFRSIFRMLSRVSFHGLENIPAEGAYIVAHNHISIFEPPLLISFWPTELEAIGAIDVWERRGQSSIVRMYGVIPVNRGKFDRRLINTMLNILGTGRPLIIAPEGTRSHTPGLQQAWPGVGYIVDKARVPVVPVGVVGSTPDAWRQIRKFRRPPLEVRIGKPLNLPPLEGSPQSQRAGRQSNTDQIMREIAALLPSGYRGVYGDSGPHSAKTA